MNRLQVAARHGARCHNYFSGRRLVGRHHPRGSAENAAQAGQAVVEALICLLALAVLWVAIAWLGRLQDLGTHALHAARYAAFGAAREFRDAAMHAAPAAVFRLPNAQWVDRQGNRLPSSVYSDMRVLYQRGSALAPESQIGGASATMQQLRRDWQVTEDGVLSAQVRLAPVVTASGGDDTRQGAGADRDGALEAADSDRGATLDAADSAGRALSLRLYQLEQAYPVLHRHISILSGSGHAAGDLASADNLARSSLVWSGPVHDSQRHGEQVSDVASRLDRAWRRPDPVFDWLKPWADQVPVHHLHSFSEGERP